MSIRVVAAVAFAVSIPAAMAPAQTAAAASPPAAAPGGAPFAYAPGVQRYHVTTVLHREQMQGGGRAPFEYDVTTHEWVAVDLERKSRDTLSMTVTVDSIAISSTIDLPKPDVAKLRGAKIQGLVSTSGRAVAFDPPAGTTDPQIAQLYAGFKNFLLPVTTQPLAKGITWGDTVIVQGKRGGLDIVSQAVSTYKIAGDTTVQGQHAWRVERTTYVNQKGTGKEAGEPLEMTGSGTITGVHLISDEGRFLGAQSTQRHEINERMNESVGAPIQQTIKSTVELLPAR